MALKADRYEIITDVSFFMNETAERGGIAYASTAGSGSAMDQSSALVTYAVTNPSGQSPVGMLMNDMVDVDLSKYKLNEHKDEVQKGGKVCLMFEGWAVTNMIYPGITPTVKSVGYAGPSGYITTTAPTDSSGANLKCGKFLSTKDEDGYAKFYVKLPQD